MATAYKRLGSTVVVANTDTQLYVVPASTETIVSSIVACNIGSTERTFRIALIEGAIGTVSNDDYIYYDVVLPANDTFIATAGFTLNASDTIMVRADHAEVVFSAFGS